ncbi:MAG TPA: crosslink repair DNA glycosylase YcaQ family protein, partial [Polyangiaceae bacterium]|nr:crosslink repair DNA glycosylase YcaQ family protein [Polyangiaceae bacterium]
MNVNLLIDAIVRQTTVLIAQLATAAGARAPLAHTANQVFYDLVRELRDQGLRNKVIADMFGLSLRTYHNKIARLSESSTDRGRSLWEALLAFASERPSVSRTEILERFKGDEEPVVRGVLTDLVDSGLLFRTGRGDLTTYRAARADEAPKDAASQAERTASLVWVAVHRYGPLTRGDLASHVPAGEDALDSALARLVRDRRVASEERGDKLYYSSAECVIPVGDAAGWEAAVFDHYQA